MGVLVLLGSGMLYCNIRAVNVIKYALVTQLSVLPSLQGKRLQEYHLREHEKYGILLLNLALIVSRCDIKLLHRDHVL